jgi:hypothetical protein
MSPSITVVQFESFNGADSGNMPSNVTAGNDLIYLMFSYTNTGATITTSNPTFGGSSVTSPSELASQQGGGTATVYGAAWLANSVAGGAKGVGITVTNGNVDANVGLAVAEVNVTGGTLTLDTSVSNNPAMAPGNSANPASGSTGSLNNAPSLLVGMAVEYGVAVTAPGSPWTAPGNGQPSSLCAASYQVVASAGSPEAYNTTSGSGQRWIAILAALYVQPPVPSGSGLLMACFP